MLERQRTCRAAGRALRGAMARERLWSGSLVMVLAAASGWVAPADAQWVERLAVGSAGPALMEASAALRSATPAARPVNAGLDRAAAMALRLENRHKLMIFGTAIFLTGAIIGDDAGTVIMIGGAATALYGLYRTLWPPDENGRGSERGMESEGLAPPRRAQRAEPLPHPPAHISQQCSSAPPVPGAPLPSCNSAGRESS